jgi:hypothetical protein
MSYRTGCVICGHEVTLPELALIAGTRAALGAGLGFLLADRLTEDGRKAVGWTLLLVGALSTVPLAFEVLGGGRLSALDRWLEPSESGSESESQDRLMRRGAPSPT